MKLVEATDFAPAFDLAFEALLAPVTGGDEDGGGVSLRYGTLYQQIRDARHHDDATLPIGE